MRKTSNMSSAEDRLVDSVRLTKGLHNQRVRVYLKSHGWFKILLSNLNPNYWQQNHPELFFPVELFQNGFDTSDSKLKYDEMCPACGEIITRSLSTSPLNAEKSCPTCQSTYTNSNQLEEGDLP